MTTDILSLARAALEDDAKATPAPWTVKSEWTGEHSGANVIYGASGQVVCQCDEHDGGYGGGERNVEIIAAARTREPQLAKAVVELSEQLAEQKHHSDAFDARIESIVNGLSAADLAESDSLRAEVDAWRNCFICPDCGRGAVDEDGLCTTCGGGCLVLEDGKLSLATDDDVRNCHDNAEKNRQLRAQLAATQEALTEACEIAEQNLFCIENVMCPRCQAMIETPPLEQIDALRKLGAKP